ncbi:hypothetical protein Ancab_025007 [Ancistrocladus abbreviatus]
MEMGVLDDAHVFASRKNSAGALMEDVKASGKRRKEELNKGFTAGKQSIDTLQRGENRKSVEGESGPSPQWANLELGRRSPDMHEDRTWKPMV